MGILSLFSAFKDQSILGLWICIIILIIGLIFIFISFDLARYYKRLLGELANLRENDEERFSDKVLIRIYDEFKFSLRKGTERVNTTAIVNKNIPEGIYLKEELLNYFISAVIILGLLGTFIGLTGSVQKITGVLRELEDVKEFTEQIKGPLASMSTAFFTSIFGIIASILMNLVALGSFRGVKARFHDEIEDYLDNYVYVKYSRNYNELLYVFTNKVESSMKYMTDKVTVTFDTGIEKFVERINGVSLDLTQSAITLNHAIDKLDITINSFNRPVNTFKESIDNFRLYYEGFDFKINEIAKIAKDLMTNIELTIKALNENKEQMIGMGQELSKSTDNLASSYERLMSLVERIEQYSNRNDELLKDRVKDMAESHRQLISALDMFKKEIGTISVNVSTALKDSFREESARIVKDLGSRMESPLNSLSSINMSTAENIVRLAKTMNSLEKMIEEIDNQYSLKTNGLRYREVYRDRKNRGDVGTDE
jgi:methyl-accepting chemotaxis protein